MEKAIAKNCDHDNLVLAINFNNTNINGNNNNINNNNNNNNNNETKQNIIKKRKSKKKNKLSIDNSRNNTITITADDTTTTITEEKLNMSTTTKTLGAATANKIEVEQVSSISIKNSSKHNHNNSISSIGYDNLIKLKENGIVNGQIEDQSDLDNISDLNKKFVDCILNNGSANKNEINYINCPTTEKTNSNHHQQQNHYELHHNNIYNNNNSNNVHSNNNNDNLDCSCLAAAPNKGEDLVVKNKIKDLNKVISMAIVNENNINNFGTIDNNIIFDDKNHIDNKTGSEIITTSKVNGNDKILKIPCKENIKQIFDDHYDNSVVATSSSLCNQEFGDRISNDTPMASTSTITDLHKENLQYVPLPSTSVDYLINISPMSSESSLFSPLTPLPSFLSLTSSLKTTPTSINLNDINIVYKAYENELQMPDIMRLIQKDLSEPYSIYTYRYFIHNWPQLCFLAMYNDICVGAIVCKLDLHRHTIRRGYIAMLAVDKDYRKLKIGTNLVQKAIMAMLAESADEVVLETEITNIPALRLYENLGFVRDKRLFDYYLNGVDALRLKLWFR